MLENDASWQNSGASPGTSHASSALSAQGVNRLLSQQAECCRPSGISPDAYSTTLRNRTLGVNGPNGAGGAAYGDRAICFQITVHDQRTIHGSVHEKLV